MTKKIKVTNEVKGECLREVVLNGEVRINVGKFKSHKLVLAMRNLTNELKTTMNLGVELKII